MNFHPTAPFAARHDEPDGVDVAGLLRTAKRRAGIGVLAFAVVFVLILWFFLQEEPLYRASATIVLEPRETDIAGVDGVLSELDKRLEVIETEVRVITSRSLTHRVIDRLDLENDPAFAPAPRGEGIKSRFWKAAGGLRPGAARNEAAAEEDPGEHRRTISNRLLRNLSAYREGSSLAIAISYTSPDPDVAARIANAYAAEYVDEQASEKFEATASANAKLGERLFVLQREVEVAERAVTAFKREKGLLDIEGSLVGEQEIGDLSVQLSAARSDLASKTARYEIARATLRDAPYGEEATPLDSPLIEQLRIRLAETQGELSVARQRYKPSHPHLAALETELYEISTLMGMETDRRLDVLASDVEAARRHVRSLEDRVGQTEELVGEKKAAEVELRELERKAAAAVAIYENFLSRLEELEAQDGFEQSDARIISEAIVPRAPVSPRPTLATALALSSGFAAGLLAIALAELLSTSVATPIDLARAAGTPCIAVVPKERLKLTAKQYRKSSLSPRQRARLQWLMMDITKRLRASPERRATVGLFSPDEGKGRSALVLSLAKLAAGKGIATVVIDTAAKKDGSGLLAGRSAFVPLDETGRGERLSLGEGLPDIVRFSAATADLDQETVGDLMEAVKSRYDLVIIDAPALLNSPEAHLFADVSDAAYLVVAWQKTPSSAASDAAQMLGETKTALAGSILADVSPRVVAGLRYGD